MAWTVDGLAAHLFERTKHRVSEMGRHLGEGADLELQGLTKRAAHLILADHGQQPGNAIDEAVAALAELVDKAEELARNIPGYPPDLLGELSFFPALSWFCPRYPFCD
ncbi:MAG: hypothetical protein QOG13_400 [Sphingomonadales bacterium]|jgi:hypothetical protein|nr:hypothetical protein [Sphingomonadales bacterium]MEA3044968.1 hypothetical protein [Sphingomonadales bacterium]